MPSSATRWNDQDFARASTRCQAPVHAWFAQTPQEMARMRRNLLSSSPIRPVYPNLTDVDFDAKLDVLYSYPHPPEITGISRLHSGAFRRRRALLGLGLASRRGRMTVFSLENRTMQLEPTPSLYSEVLQSIKNRIESISSPEAMQLLQRLPWFDPVEPSLPSKSFLTSLNDEVMGLIDQLGLPTHLVGEWDATGLKTLLERSLPSQTSEDARVKPRVVISESVSRAIVKRNGTITIPAGYMRNGIDALVLVVRLRLALERFYQGEKTGYYILLNGTVADLTAGPAILGVVEQVIRGQVDRFAGEDGYLACSVAAGTGAGLAQWPREVYATMLAYYRWTDVEVASPDQMSAEDRAWRMTWEVFQGTDLATSGAFVGFKTRETAGSHVLWGALKRDPRIVKYFPMGKFDPGSSTETAILREAGIIPYLR